MTKRQTSKTAIRNAAVRDAQASSRLEGRQVPTGYQPSQGVSVLLERRKSKSAAS